MSETGRETIRPKGQLYLRRIHSSKDFILLKISFFGILPASGARIHEIEGTPNSCRAQYSIGAWSHFHIGALKVNRESVTAGFGPT
ncbi:MAG: hypothetical protein L0229_26625 [Blastocatellia bacterium]|nr:hypothetical protein [Blastocatellia bacterium]